MIKFAREPIRFYQRAKNIKIGDTISDDFYNLVADHIFQSISANIEIHIGILLGAIVREKRNYCHHPDRFTLEQFEIAYAKTTTK